MIALQTFVLSLLGLCLVVRAEPWIVTQHVIISTSELLEAYTFIDGDVDPALIGTYTLRATPTVSPLPTDLPVLTIRPTRTYDRSVTSVLVELPASLGATVTGYDYLYSDNDYYVGIVYTAPASCSPGWTYTTSVEAFAPAGATPPHSTGVVYTSTNYRDVETTVTGRIIEPTELPEGAYSSLSSLWEPFWSRSCSIPAYVTGSSSGGGYGGGSGNDDSTFTYSYGDDDSDGDCSNQRYRWYWVEFSSCLSLAQLILIIFFSIAGFFFLTGLAQNLYSFVSLCKGLAARRGLPWLWCLMFPILSCIFLLGSSQGFGAKSQEEQAVLRQRWSQLSFGTKLGQWLAWGFRKKYPPFLGPAPSPRGVVPPTRVPPSTGMVEAQAQHQSVGNNIAGAQAAGHTSAAPVYTQQPQTQFQVWDTQTQSWQPWNGGSTGNAVVPVSYQASHYQEQSQQNVSSPSEVSAQPAPATFGTAQVTEMQPKAGAVDVRELGDGRK